MITENIENIENGNGNKNQTNGATHPEFQPVHESPPVPSVPLVASVPSHTRNGKIARLPLEIREQVNQFLRSGLTYSHILSKLAELGHPGISINSISTWKHGGYIEWLQEQQQAEARLASLKALERCTRAGEIDRLQQNALALAADQLSLIMLKFDADRALAILYQKPQLFPAFIAALSSLARCSSDLAKSFNVVQSAETSLRQQTTGSSVGPCESVSVREEQAEMQAHPRFNLHSHSEPTQTNSESAPPSSEQFQPILSDSE